MVIGRRRGQGSEHLKPRDSQGTSFNKERPIFSLHYLQNSHCISRCSKAEKAAFADALHRRSQLSWGELKQAPRHGLGYEAISRDSIKTPIPRAITEDVTIIAFRSNGKAPMLGYRDKAIFHIVWIDRDFTVYDHG